MKTISILLVVLLLSTWGGLAKAVDQPKDFEQCLTKIGVLEFPNGKAWKLYDLAQKSSYIIGIRDGVSLAGANIQGPIDDVTKSRIARLISGIQGNDVLKAIDAFYTDALNTKVPIHMAYDYMTIKIHYGDTAASDFLAKTRKLCQ